MPFLAVLYLELPGASYIALAIFIAASLTDMLDGRIARQRNLVTDFGKFADPLADKMLVTAAMLWFVERGQMPAWAVLIVIVREFAVSGLRMVASDQGRVIAAGWSGKVKTAATMVCLVVMFLPVPPVPLAPPVPPTLRLPRRRLPKVFPPPPPTRCPMPALCWWKTTS